MHIGKNSQDVERILLRHGPHNFRRMGCWVTNGTKDTYEEVGDTFLLADLGFRTQEVEGEEWAFDRECCVDQLTEQETSPC